MVDKIAPRLSKDIIKRGLFVAAVVGPILTLINQWRAVMDWSGFDFGKWALTMIVPFCVSTVSSLLALRKNKEVTRLKQLNFDQLLAERDAPISVALDRLRALDD